MQRSECMYVDTKKTTLPLTGACVCMYRLRKAPTNFPHTKNNYQINHQANRKTKDTQADNSRRCNGRRRQTCAPCGASSWTPLRNRFSFNKSSRVTPLVFSKHVRHTRIPHALGKPARSMINRAPDGYVWLIGGRVDECGDACKRAARTRCTAKRSVAVS